MTTVSNSNNAHEGSIPVEPAVIDLPGHNIVLGEQVPLSLVSGQKLGPFTISYQTYGKLNADRSNAILVCHALTGDQFAAEVQPITGNVGWWNMVVGSELPIDTDRYYVICINVLGGCMGSAGPRDINPKTGKQFGLSFPLITITDIVAAQKLVIDYLGIEKLFCVTGGSMGAMQVLEWASKYPHRVSCAIPIAGAARHSAQNIAFHEVGRQAIMSDPDWRNGNYYENQELPNRGLSVARMAAHITYMSDSALHRKFGRELQDRTNVSYGFEADFQIESYLRHQGNSFVERFDANSYLYITRAMDYFDLAAEHDDVLANAFLNTDVKFCLISFTSDWLFPSSESRQIVHALNAVGASVSFVEVNTDSGHDAFLLNEPEFFSILSGFIAAAADQSNI